MVSPAVLLLAPLLYALAALVPDRLVGGSLRRRWRLALRVASVPPVVALGAAVMLAAHGPAVGHLASGAAGGLHLSTRLDVTTVVMLCLVTSIAALILRFSRRYLDGEAGQARYVRWLLATMAAASLLVVTNDLLVLAVAWLASSVALHQLLTFYDTRPQALIAAHKKFLFGRVADVAIFAAIALLWRATGTLEIDAIDAWATAAAVIPGSVKLAGLLLAAGVVVRAAQLPFHGWLIQVMEAPTPVSALLHAGIVNIGGFVLIRLSGLMVLLDGAQWLLVMVGTVTALLAALVMTTRVSIKVALAWSTCAQMGFMLLECGLGAYGLALLHLVAHSLYKAHAFLSSGRAVEEQSLRRMTPAAASDSPVRWALAAAGGFAVVATLGLAFGIGVRSDPALLAMAPIVALALAPLLRRAAEGGAARALRLGGGAITLAALYAGWHALVGRLMPAAPGASSSELLRIGFVAVAFVLLYALQVAIATRPTGRLARTLYPACFAGFYLDEMMTRLTFKIWPPRAAVAAVAAGASNRAPALSALGRAV
ncbi:MAG: NADH-quinone oxidoreductase subunit L [Gemmatimonadetes bacterium]|nr:NADH-quinone oxidoreductase subunit L [Gemmatimonadota bacterium]